MSKLEKAKVVIIGETVILQDAIIEDNSIIVDFTGISPGNYYLCFFLNELVWHSSLISTEIRLFLFDF